MTPHRNAEQADTVLLSPIRLVVNSLSMGSHGSLLECFSQSRVSMACTSNILRRGTIFERQSTFSNHLTSVGTDNVDSEKAVSLGVSDHLDHAVGVEVGLCTRVGTEWESTDAVGDLLVLQVLLARSNPRNFRIGVHDGGDAAIVDVAITLLDVLNHCDSLFLGLVGKHLAESAVADTADVGDLGAIFRIDNNPAALVELHTDVLEAESLSVGTTTDSHQNNVRLQLSCLY